MIEKIDWNRRSVRNLDSDWRKYSMKLQEKEGQKVFYFIKTTCSLAQIKFIIVSKTLIQSTLGILPRSEIWWNYYYM